MLRLFSVIYINNFSLKHRKHDRKIGQMFEARTISMGSSMRRNMDDMSREDVLKLHEGPIRLHLECYLYFSSHLIRQTALSTPAESGKLSFKTQDMLIPTSRSV